MGGAATARERQAALRDRRRKDGLNYIHVWANADQERAIKAFLADPAANTLHVTHKSASESAPEPEYVSKLRSDLEHQKWELQRLQQEVAVAEQKLEAQRKTRDADEASIEKRKLVAEKAILRYEALAAEYENWNAEFSRRMEEIRERERELNVLEKDLKVAGARLKRDGDAKKVSDKARTEALIQQFTTERDYRANGVVYKPIDDDWKIERRVQELAKLTARTKTVRTSLSTLAREFKETLGDRETDDLMDADNVLFRISNAAGIALKRARTLEAKLKEEEKQRHQAAYKAATAYLQPLGDAEQVMLLCILYNTNFELGKFLGAEPAYWKSMAERLAEVKKQTHDYVRNKIKDYLKGGMTLDQGIAHLASVIGQSMPEAKETYGRRIERAIAAVVAERLAQATGV